MVDAGLGNFPKNLFSPLLDKVSHFLLSIGLKPLEKAWFPAWLESRYFQAGED